MGMCALALLARGASAGPIDDMISPVSAPVTNEDPRVTTEIRPLYIYHQIASDFVTGGGRAQVAAVQARIAITERFGFIATKDGYVWLNTDDVVPDDDGWANIAFDKGASGGTTSGQHRQRGLALRGAVGNRQVFQGNGDGVLNSSSLRRGIDRFHLQLYSGRASRSGRRLDLRHVGTPTTDRILHPLWGSIGCALDGGRRCPSTRRVRSRELRLDGGGRQRRGHGGHRRALSHRRVDGRGRHQRFPLTSREDIFGWRVTADVIIRPFGWKLPWRSRS
jgi:hypothetical protein